MSFSNNVQVADNPGFNESLWGAWYRAVFERKQQPDPGAQAYAYETYGLPAFSPIGAGTHAYRDRMPPLGPPPLYTSQGVTTLGVPTTAGQFILQPLYVPSQDRVGGQT